jgi:hypothetical protein
VLVIELHGLAAAGETTAILDRMGYAYVDATSGRRFANASQVLDGQPDRPFQIVAEPSA